MKISRCANEQCLAIYLEPLEYEPLAAFCPECRRIIKERLSLEDEAWALDDCGATH